MKTPSERPSISIATGSGGELPEAFEPPSLTSLASLTDGRKPGEYKTVYPISAWAQIFFELLYLLIVLVGSFAALVFLGKYTILRESTGLVHDVVGDLPESRRLVMWAAVTLAGCCGGCASSLKWLYHGVAKMRWHRDRLIWRLVVPVLSAVLAVFAAVMVVSGLVPFLNSTPLSSPATGAAFGFFVGFFSDNVLAGLQKLALRVFGTIDKSPSVEKTGLQE